MHDTHHEELNSLSAILPRFQDLDALGATCPLVMPSRAPDHLRASYGTIKCHG